MSDKHLERKEVLNLVYTQQADRMADAYARLMADFSQTTAWGRGLESDLSWARSELMQVKAEVELWKLRSDNWQKFCQLTRPEMTDELNRLKAEVERLKMSAYNRLSMRIEIDKLNARIERLIKAGDLMADGINGDYNYSLPCIEKWEAAKEGKQSND